MRRLVFLLSFLLLWLYPHSLNAQTTLAPGDIALIGFNADNPDELAFVMLTDISAGTEFHFTDRGWLAAGGFRPGEGSFTWTAAQAYPAGSVIQPVLSGIALASAGDQIFIFQGEESTPSMLYGLNAEGDGWQADATSANTSALPPTLTAGVSAVALPEVDNAVYAGPTSGTPDELRTAIGDPTNWQGSNSSRQDMPTTPFSVQSPTAVRGLSQQAQPAGVGLAVQLLPLLGLSLLTGWALRVRGGYRPLQQRNGRSKAHLNSRETG